MKVETDGFSFDFKGALNAFVFDGEDKTQPTFHGAPMKAVDVIAEFDTAYVYVEIKDFFRPETYSSERVEGDVDSERRADKFNQLKSDLKYKYRDSYLYRHAEGKVDKPVRYVCLLNFDYALNAIMADKLRDELPVGRPTKRWKRAIVESCHVVNLERWNRVFPNWPARKI